MLSKIFLYFRQCLKKKLFRCSQILINIAQHIHQSSQENQLFLWKNINGDQTLRLDYDLNENSIVFDLGGFQGQWASDIFSKYQCYVHIFEPVNEFANTIEERFKKNSKIVVHRYGLSNADKSLKIGINQDSSSVYKNNTVESESIRLFRAEHILKELNIGHIDLMKINIEGGEYELLIHLIESNLLEKISNIQVQFHSFVPNHEELINIIYNGLMERHFATYQYPYIWENWRLRSE